MFVVRSPAERDIGSLWLRKFTFSWNKYSQAIFWSYDLIKIRDCYKPVDWHATDYFSIGFVVNPKKWRIGSDHTYYDGTHCAYFFGPIMIASGLNHECKQCNGYR